MDNYKHIYFVGIKGIAMAALAVWAKENGKQVSGTDIDEEFPSDPILKKAGISVEHGFDQAHIRKYKPDVVVYTGAHNGRDNVEVQAAIHLHIPVYSHGQALGLAMKGKFQISIAGSHGKTTTASMIATVFRCAEKDPSYAIGCGEIRGLGNPGHMGKGNYFIAEADEYVTDPKHDDTPRFLWQNPDILVVTNIDFDHPDVYKNIQDVQHAFIRLQKQQKGNKVIVINKDDRMSDCLTSAGNEYTLLTYGTTDEAKYRIHSIHHHTDKTTFHINHNGEDIGEFTLRVPGVHNVHNAVAAIIVAMVEEIPVQTIQACLMHFAGAKRRFEKIADTHGVHFYDDYAHHPKEIAATLKAVKDWYPEDRIITIFQPHTYSRTKSLFTEFSHAFTDSDIVCITDIYASAREKETFGINGTMLASEIARFHTDVHFTPASEDIYSFIRKTCKTNDRVIFMGAGNIYVWGADIVKTYSNL